MSRRNKHSLASELIKCFKSERDPILKPTIDEASGIEITHFDQSEYAKLAATKLLRKDYNADFFNEFERDLLKSEHDSAQKFLREQVAKYGSPELQRDVSSRLSVTERKAFEQCILEVQAESAKEEKASSSLKSDLKELDGESESDHALTHATKESTPLIGKEEKAPKGGRGGR